MSRIKAELDNSTYVVSSRTIRSSTCRRCGPCSGGRGLHRRDRQPQDQREPVSWRCARKASRGTAFARPRPDRPRPRRRGAEETAGNPGEITAVRFGGLDHHAWGSQALSPLDPGLRAFPESLASGGCRRRPLVHQRLEWLRDRSKNAHRHVGESHSFSRPQSSSALAANTAATTRPWRGRPRRLRVPGAPCRLRRARPQPVAVAPHSGGDVQRVDLAARVGSDQAADCFASAIACFSRLR